MHCPECGTNAGDAKFCPECGADLGPYRAVRAQSGRGRTTTGAYGDKGGPGVAGLGGAHPDADAGGAAPPGLGPGISRLILYGGAAVVALVILVLVITRLGSAQKQPAAAGSPTAPSTSVPSPSISPSADTSGSYEQLVARANGLYDQGSTLFAGNDVNGAARYFAAAAQVYRAAWKKQPGDPSVGTDWATSLFYAGNIDAALQTVDMVLAQSPDFQPAHFNKANFLAHKARLAREAGQTQQAEDLFAEAKAEYQRAAAIDPSSELGKQAAAEAAKL